MAKNDENVVLETAWPALWYDERMMKQEGLLHGIPDMPVCPTGGGI